MRVQFHRQRSELPTDVGLMITGFFEGFLPPQQHKWPEIGSTLKVHCRTRERERESSANVKKGAFKTLRTETNLNYI